MSQRQPTGADCTFASAVPPAPMSNDDAAPADQQPHAGAGAQAIEAVATSQQRGGCHELLNRSCARLGWTARCSRCAGVHGSGNQGENQARAARFHSAALLWPRGTRHRVIHFLFLLLLLLFCVCLSLPTCVALSAAAVLRSPVLWPRPCPRWSPSPPCPRCRGSPQCPWCTSLSKCCTYTRRIREAEAAEEEEARSTSRSSSSRQAR